MAFETLISTTELAPHVQNPDWAILDCRFSLEEPDLGLQTYVASHIPGALYVHLEHDLCGPIHPGQGSRHPFPPVEAFAERLSAWGIDTSVQVVVYDDFQGGIAVRLWRMLGWLGHRSVALLDGGWPRWVEEGRPVRTGPEMRPARTFVPSPRPELLVSTDEVLQLLASPSHLVLDTRSDRSYTGQRNPSSPTSGHIPGARNMHFADNVAPDGLMRDMAELSSIYRSILGGRPAGQVIAYCTSGVTASLNILVMQHLGLGEARLYAGSWDEWTTHPNRPVEKLTPDPKRTA